MFSYTYKIVSKTLDLAECDTIDKVSLAIDAYTVGMHIAVNSSNLRLFDTLMRPQVSYDRFIKETMRTQDTLNKHIKRRFKGNAIRLREENYAEYGRILREETTLRVGDGFSREWKIDKNINDNLITSDDFSKQLKKRVKGDTIYCYDERVLPNAGGILSDIAIKDNEMDLDDFEDTMETPAGYNKFTPFRVGDYEYKDALYRLRIDKSGGTSNPLIYDYKIHVDIDDVKDRGMTDIPAEITKVYFNRSYYTEPDVVVNVVSGEEGTVIIPYIVDTDGQDDKGRYFTVILKDEKGNPVAGTISWNSNGY